MKLEDDDFTLFGLAPAFALDRAALDARWRAWQAQVHPDRFAAEGAAAQRVALQWATRINEAYRRLRDPVARAAYLCALRGAPVEPHGGAAAMPAGFLVQQMEWRERMEEAARRRDAQALRELDAEAAAAEGNSLARLAQQLDGMGGLAAANAGTPHGQALPEGAGTAAAGEAAATVRALMFVQRLREDLARQLEPFED
ncbi:MAG: co-chaperone protein HscB [Pseudomonadota bacterium]|jgi:molecular chaperone HscB